MPEDILEFRLTPPEGTRGNRCRYGRPSCGAPAVAWIMRGTWRGQKRAWAYCGDHLFGRWIEDGRVFGWRLNPVRVDSKAD